MRTRSDKATPAPPAIVAAIDALLAAGLHDEARPLIERFGESLIRAGTLEALERRNATLAAADSPDTPKALLLRARMLAERNALEALAAYRVAWAEANLGIALIERLDKVAARPGVPVSHRLTWERESALYYVQFPNPDPDACRARIDRHEAGMPADTTAHHRFNLARLRYDLAFIERDFERAEQALVAARAQLDPRLPVQAISLAHMETKLALMRGQYRRAQVSAKKAVLRADQVQVPDVIANVYLVNSLMALTYSAEFDEAREVSARLVRDAHGRHKLIYETSAAVLKLAEAKNRGGPIEAEVGGVLAAIERTGSFRAFNYNRPLGAEVCGYALEHDINPPTARRIIQHMRFDPPSNLPYNGWPVSGGACPAGTIAVKRVYNGRWQQNDSNHRYVTTEELYAQMTAQGWSGEGTVFCARV